MTCSRIKNDCLIEYVDGMMPPEEANQLREHLAECSDCDNEVAELQSLFSELEKPPEVEEPEHDLLAALAPALVKPDRLVLRLRETVALRDVKAATRLAEDCADRVAEMDPFEPQPTAMLDSAALLDAFTQVIDMGLAHRGAEFHYTYLDVAKAALAKFPKNPRDGIRLDVCAHLEMVEGILAMHCEQFDDALPHFQFVAALGPRVSEKELGVVANYYLASAHSKMGTYPDAAECISTAIALAAQANRPQMAAASEVLKAWILLQQNQGDETRRILDHARENLIETTDRLSLGNVDGTLGRLALREGLCADALYHFDRALEYYRKYDPQHRNVARTLVNIAFVKRLIALRSVKVAQISLAAKSASEASRLRTEAKKHLDDALAMYDSSHKSSAHGKCRTLTVRALLDFDEGHLDQALECAVSAEDLASKTRNSILAARVQIIRCMVEDAKSNASDTEGTSPGLQAERARSHARVALRHAVCTHRDRLIARAHIWLGITSLNPYFNDKTTALNEYDQAVMLLGKGDRDHVWDDLQLLKSKLSAAGIAVPNS